MKSKQIERGESVREREKESADITNKHTNLAITVLSDMPEHFHG